MTGVRGPGAAADGVRPSERPSAVAAAGDGRKPDRSARNERRSAGVRRVLARVLVLNLVVVVAKLFAWASSDAVSVLAEALHSSLDAANNVFALWIARVASREPDEHHPYGHQKFETLGALLLVVFLSVTVFELLRESFVRFSEGSASGVEATPLAVGVMAASALVGLGVSLWESRRGRSLGSDLLLADAAHTRSDVFTTFAVLIGLGAVAAGYPLADPIVAVVVAVIIGWTGWQIVRRAVPVLVDERAVDPGRIQRVAEAHEEVHACYQIRSRGQGPAVFAELTIAVDPALDVARSHDIADAVEAEVARALGAQEVVVHVEPAR